MNLMNNMRLANGKIANYDEVKKIHYGVINQNRCNLDAVDDIYQNGTDIYYEGALQDLKDAIVATLEDNAESTDEDTKEALLNQLDNVDKRFGNDLVSIIMAEAELTDRIKEAVSYIDDEFGQQWDSGYCTSYGYKEDGYEIRLNTDDGDMFICDSPYFTYCRQCSPCAPNAGYLTDRGGGMKSFCLGVDWFEDNKPPYDVYEVATGKRIYTAEEEQEDEDA